MKKLFSILVAISLVYSVVKPIQLKAAPKYEQGQLYMIECSAYCNTGETATQTQARPGIAAFAPEYYGWAAVVTMPDGENHIYIIEDTGSDPVKNGECLDIWMPTEEECKEFGRQNLRCFFVRGKG